MQEHAPVPLDSDQDAQDYDEKWARANEKRILQQPNVAQRLEELRIAGADGERVLRLLASSVSGDHTSVKNLLRERRAALRKLSEQLEAAATALERCFAEPLNFSAFWMSTILPIGILPPDMAVLSKVPSDTTKSLRSIALALRIEQKTLALGTQYPRLMEDAAISAILAYLKTETGNFHDEIAADLLQAAHYALGSSRLFSGESLRKFRQRQAGDLLESNSDSSYGSSAMLDAVGWDDSDAEI